MGPSAGKLPVMCPSGRCREGSLLLGVVGEGGRVGLLSEAIAVDAAFAAAAQAAGGPEQRLRFAEPCATGGCGQWTGTRCGVIDHVLSRPAAPAAGLPACAIRPACRWFLQSGPDACMACPLVVTDGRPAIRPTAESSQA